MYKFILVVFLFLLSLSSCDQTDDCECIPCYRQVIVSEEEYLTAPDDHLVIDSLALEGDCLTLFYSSSGCNGDTWQLKLIDSEAIMESFPPQRNLRLSLKNEELCDAWFSRQITFDVSKLQLNGSPVWLNITNSDHRILYEYN